MDVIDFVLQGHTPAEALEEAERRYKGTVDLMSRLPKDKPEPSQSSIDLLNHLRSPSISGSRRHGLVTTASLQPRRKLKEARGHGRPYARYTPTDADADDWGSPPLTPKQQRKAKRIMKRFAIDPVGAKKQNVNKM